MEIPRYGVGHSRPMFDPLISTRRMERAAESRHVSTCFMDDSHVSRRFPTFRLKIGRSLAQFTTRSIAVLRVEEFHQRGSKDFCLDFVGLTFQGTMLAVGDSLRQRYCCGIHERE